MNLPKKLFLCGPIGCGKSTMIKHALGAAAARAGGFVTLRQTDGDRLLGFSLAPAAALVDPSQTGALFLDFSRKPPQNNRVFADLGTGLLTEAVRYSFCVADEFGGLELLVPEFREALWAMLRRDQPCIGVFKTPEAVQKLQARIPLGSAYPALEQELRAYLQQAPDVLLLPTTGYADPKTPAILARWAHCYTNSLEVPHVLSD